MLILRIQQLQISFYFSLLDKILGLEKNKEMKETFIPIPIPINFDRTKIYHSIWDSVSIGIQPPISLSCKKVHLVMLVWIIFKKIKILKAFVYFMYDPIFHNLLGTKHFSFHVSQIVDMNSNTQVKPGV